MLDRVNPWGRPVRPSLGSEIVAEIACERWQLHAYRELRRLVFAREQALFEESDWDAHDEHALPIVACSQIAGMPDRVVGVVRIYEASPRVWYGGRLAVHPEFRRFGAVGTALIRAAVSSAHALGATLFLATVQEANVRYFERHHFSVLEPLVLREKPHQLMRADLASYPPFAVGARFVQARVA